MAYASNAGATIPEGVEFHYLAEGAANIVYRIANCLGRSTPEQSVLDDYGDGTPPPSIIEYNSSHLWEMISRDKLIRFRKDLPTTVSCAKAQANWERLIKPLFPAHQLVHQALVSIQPGYIIAKLNEDLRMREVDMRPPNSSLETIAPRPTKRHGTYLADDDHALLVTDMTPHNGEELIQFKPKWLSQSPSAPKASKRCRQCSRMARLNAERTRHHEQPVPFFCPLDLISKQRDEISPVANLVMEPGVSNSQITRFIDWLEHTDILDNLKAYQIELDPTGVMKTNSGDEKLLAAMTLRDCTVYVKCTSRDPGEWEARLGDLDLKSKAKIPYWQDVENSLIEEGWYEGIETVGNRQALICRLSRGT